MEAEIVSYSSYQSREYCVMDLDLNALSGALQLQEMAVLLHTLTRAYSPLEDTNGKLWSPRRLLDDSGHRRHSKFAHDPCFKVNRKHVCGHRYVTPPSPTPPANPYL